MEKVIVTCWYDINTQTPYSVERISTSVADVMEFLKENTKCFGDTIEFAEGLSGFREGKFIDGKGYLKNLKNWNCLGTCYARMYSSFFEEDERDYKYFMFQVRNLH